jgi:hypothetical protein
VEQTLRTAFILNSTAHGIAVAAHPQEFELPVEAIL